MLVALDGDHGGVLKQTVHRCGCEQRVCKERVEFRDSAVGCNDRRDTLVPGSNHLIEFELLVTGERRLTPYPPGFAG